MSDSKNDKILTMRGEVTEALPSTLFRVMLEDDKEILAYLLQAVYSRADDAFLLLLNRNFMVSTIMPKLDQDLRQKGTRAFLESEHYLSDFAKNTLDEMFTSLTGRSHSDQISGNLIQVVQSSDFIKPENIQLIERSLYNPSRHRRKTIG